MAIPRHWVAARYAARGALGRARSFKLVAEEYDRGRPTYPATAVRWLLGRRPVDVVDLGAGTGKLTVPMLAQAHRVRAVEPLAEMRAVLSRRLPELEVVAATAERTGLQAASADAVVAGAAFHWFDRARALPEIARLLRPTGTLGLLANGLDASVPWVGELQQILGDGHLAPSDGWPAHDQLLTWFDVVDEQGFEHTHLVDLSRLLDLAMSRSTLASSSAAERRRTLEQIAALWHDDPDLRGSEQVELPYVTRVLRAVRRRRR